MIICTGFYNRSNLGDDIFSIIFDHILKTIGQPYNIISLDDINKLPANTSTIILGGGEILNKYFLTKLEKLCVNFKGKIIAYSCELPAGDIISEVNLIDYFILRNKNDCVRLEKHFDSTNDLTKYIKYQPDLVFSINSFIPEYLDKNKVMTNKKVLICLARSIYPNNKYYQHYLKKIFLLIKYLKHTEWDVTLYPFNTSYSLSESDIILNADIFQLCEQNNITINNIVPQSDLNDNQKLNLAISYIKSSDIIICSRYHAHVLGIANGKPVLSIPHTKKVMEQINILDLGQYKVEPKLDDCNRPIDLDIAQFITVFENINKNKKNIIKKYSKFEFKTISEHIQIISNLLSQEKRNIPPYYVNNNIVNKIVQSTYKNTINKFNISNLKTEVDDQLRNRITRYVLYFLCKDPDAIYYWGLLQKICKPEFNYLGDFEWIIKDYYSKNSFEFTFNSQIKDIDSKNKIFNLTYIEPHLLKNIHRSGWYQVVQNTGILHNEQGIIFDMFVDKTFHWGENTYVDLNLIPYQKPWIGIVHHTPDPNYTQFNTTKMIKKDSWIKSLDCCIGIYTMSNWLTEWFKTNVPNLRVETLIHPTEIPEIKFNFEKFLENKNKKIVQIGGWLRNCYSIYRIVVSDFLQKCHLIGKNMENYIKPNEKWDNILNNNFIFTSENKWSISHGLSSNIESANKYIHFMKKYTKEIKIESIDELISILESNHNSVTPINNLSNEKYDELLSENIVFIDLIEASACNTLIECIVRNTPILVNPLPSVVERLGPDYPLYWNNYDEINKILTIDNICKAHEYLTKLDKSVYTYDYWIQSLFKSNIYKQGHKIVYPELNIQIEEETKLNENQIKLNDIQISGISDKAESSNNKIQALSIDSTNIKKQKKKKSVFCCFSKDVLDDVIE